LCWPDSPSPSGKRNHTVADFAEARFEHCEKCVKIAGSHIEKSLKYKMAPI
jgi:hypothetical protein